MADKQRQPVETITISKGQFGPLVGPCSIGMAPLTLLVGPQGTGKSLICQVSFFFRALRWLVQVHDAQSEYGDFAGKKGPRSNAADVARWLLDRLRSDNRAFAVFATGSARIECTPAFKHRVSGVPLGFRMDEASRVIRPLGGLRANIDAYRSEGIKSARSAAQAIYIPPERSFFSSARTAISIRSLRLGLTCDAFDQWMRDKIEPLYVGDSLDGLANEGAWIRKHMRGALGGEARRKGSRWQWRVDGSYKRFDIDLASSGQRAAWPLVAVAESVFALRSAGEISAHATLYVEEPEIHLHPSAQVALVEVLAYLVNRGFRVVATTHSLTVLSALNNVMQATRVAKSNASGLPAAEARIDPFLVAVWLLKNGKAVSLKDDAGFVDERDLARADEELGASLNRIEALAGREED